MKKEQTHWITPHLASALDKAKVTDTDEMHILTAAVDALSHLFNVRLDELVPYQRENRKTSSISAIKSYRKVKFVRTVWDSSGSRLYFLGENGAKFRTCSETSNAPNQDMNVIKDASAYA